MKIVRYLILFFILVSFSLSSNAWGFWAHKRINRMAVFTLPEGMFGFYKSNIEYVTDHAIDADKRRYALKNEAARHYIDIDHYGKNPFDLMPRDWDSAIAKYSEDTIMAYGIVPWHIEVMMLKLTWAYKQMDVNRILKYSADIGHYIGDAHVPLHTSKNYNGQLTGQRGIHGFWESRLPELYADDYDYFIGKAKFIKDPQNLIWDVIESSHQGVDSVLDFERQLTEEFPEDQKYSYETKGQTTLRVYSESFSNAYHNMLYGQVQRRMRRAIINLGNLWMTCWVNAGQPNLDALIGKELVLTEEEKQEQKELDKKFQEKDKPYGRDHHNHGTQGIDN